MKKRIFLVFLVVLSFFLVSCNTNNIVGFKYSDNGDLIGIYENGDEKNFGSPDKEDFSIESYYFNDKNELIIKYKNGTETNLGKMIKDEEDEINNDDVIYDDFILRKETNGTYAIVGYIGYGQDIVIPDEYQGIEITRITTHSIWLEEDNLPFDHFNISIGKNIEIIDPFAFVVEYLNVNLYFKENSKLKHIGHWGFGFEIINKLILPESLISVGFCSLATNENFSIPKGVQKISPLSSNVTLYSELTERPLGWSNENKYLFGVESLKKTDYFSYFTLINKEISIEKALSNTIKDLIIPDEIDGYKVTSILGNSFTNGSIETVVLGSNLREISDYSFNNNNIKELIIPNSVYLIGDYAFCNNNLKKLVIPNTLKYIGRHAFASGTLESVIFEDGSTLESIGDRAFDSNELEMIILPNSVLDVGYSILGQYNSIIYTERLEKLDGWLDSNYYIYGIKDVVEDELFQYLLTVNEELYLNKYLKYGTIDVLIIPDEYMGYPVTRIESKVFYGRKIKNLTLGKNIKVISSQSFYGHELEEVLILDSVEVIEKEAFYQYYSSIETKFYTTLKEIPIGWTREYNYIMI